MKNKRFIAGATCPNCQALDRIFTYEQEGQQRRGCVDCAFDESLEQFLSHTEELPTRVNQHRLGEKPLPHETPLERVTIIDPAKK